MLSSKTKKSFISSLLGKIFSETKNPAPNKSKRLSLESLETRQMLSITVNSLADDTAFSLHDNEVTLREAVFLAQGAHDNTVTFDDALFIADPDAQYTINLDAELLITKSITIVGPGAETLFLNGQEQSRIFNISSSSPILVNMSGFSLVDGAADNGGAVKVTGAVMGMFSDMNFVNNHSTNQGGAFHISGSASSIAMSNVEFNSNSAVHGGAIFASYFNMLIIRDARFESNEAGYGGGALSLNTGMIDISYTTFDNNDAGTMGGAILASKANVTISDSLFTNNSTTNKGGAIYQDRNLLTDPTGTALTLVNNVFEENTCDNLGGAVYVEPSTSLSVSGGSFTKNHAFKGGGIYSDARSAANITLTDVDFNENDAVEWGGAVCVYGLPRTAAVAVLSVTGGTYENNKAEHGAAIFGYNLASVDLVGTKNSPLAFTNNDATNGGGALSFNTSTVTISSATFADNDAGITGGAILVSKANVTISDSQFYNNSATNKGGAIYQDRNLSTDPTGTALTLVNNVFEENTCDNLGGAVYVEPSTNITVSGGSFTRNTAAPNKGGAICTWNTNNLVDRALINFLDNSSDIDYL